MDNRTVKLLKRLEWSGSTQGQGTGFMSSGGDGPMVACCPECGGIKPDDLYSGHFMVEYHGHRSDCDLAYDLKQLKDPTP